ncbi:MAG: hypothetical protein ACYC6L_16225, partial [Anaerolineae bacterium]
MTVRTAIKRPVTRERPSKLENQACIRYPRFLVLEYCLDSILANYDTKQRFHQVSNCSVISHRAQTGRLTVGCDKGILDVRLYKLLSRGAGD